MDSQFDRVKMVYGVDYIDRLINKKIILFGLGGVGSFVAESLVRTGIHHIDLVDNDVVKESNLNRQLIALNDTLGQKKVDLVENRLKKINKDVEIKKYDFFYNELTKDLIDYKKYDYIIDAIDTVSSKMLLIETAKKFNINIISSMGTGNKTNPMCIDVCDIYNTKICPLAKVIRSECKKRNIHNLKVVYSIEEAKKNIIDEDGRHIPGSAIFVPATAGLIIAYEVIKDLLN